MRALMSVFGVVAALAIVGTANGQEPSSPRGEKEGTILRVPGSFTLDVALTADGKLLARGGADNTVDLWDVASGKKLHTLKGHTAPIFKVTFSPDGKTLASMTGTWLPDDVPGEVKLWDVATGQERASLKGHPGRGSCLAFSADGETLASAAGGKVKLWDVETGREKREISTAARSLAFSPDGRTLATGSGGNPRDAVPCPVILWDVTSGKEKASLSGHSNSVTWVGFAPDGKTLASASSGSFGDEDRTHPLPGEVKMWDVGTAKERATIPVRTVTPFQFFPLAFTAGGKTLVSATWSYGDTDDELGLLVRHWEVSSRAEGAASWAPYKSTVGGAGTNGGIYFAALSADGKAVAWGGAEEQGGKITGTAFVREVKSLAALPPRPVK